MKIFRMKISIMLSLGNVGSDPVEDISDENLNNGEPE